MIKKHTINGELLLVAGKKERFVFRRNGLDFFAFRLRKGSEQTVGHIRLKKRLSLKKIAWTGVAECGDIVVKDEFQRKGIGSALLALCILYSEGISEITVRSNDILLLKFLKDKGFAERWSGSDRFLRSLFALSKRFRTPSEAYFDLKRPGPKVRIYVSA